MALPTGKPSSVQSSILSFFQSKLTSTAAAPTPPPQPPPLLPPQAPPPRLQAAEPPRPPAASEHSTPPEAAVRPICAADITALRRINALLLPVSYADDFYRRALDPAHSGHFSRVITWTDPPAESPKVVGGLVCRLEPVPRATEPPTHNLYIQSLCLLSPYRRLGLVNAALEHVLAAAASTPDLRLEKVFAHVWTENDEGLRWYEQRGFRRQGAPLSAYYFKLRPDSAWLVERDVGAPASAALPPPSPPPPPPAPPMARGQSYQNQRAETEWNDLPDDMAPGMLEPPKRNGSEPASNASSRSSSTARKRRDRSYPAATFASG